MAVSVTIPTGPVRRLRSGKQEIECLNAKALMEWADDQLPEVRTLALALAVKLRRVPEFQGKTLMVDLDAADGNLVTVRA